MEFDILDLASSKKGPHKHLQYLGHLSDSTPFGLVEIDMKQLTKANQSGIVGADGLPVKQALINKNVWEENKK